MTALLLYAYSVGVFSSRKVERATYEDVAFRVLAGGAHPHFTTVNAFRLEHREALAGLFVQVLRLCSRAGLSTVGHVSLDGSKIAASASKHKAMSYGRMKREEQRLAAEIESLLFRAEQTDQREDEQYGRGERPDDLPRELQRREARLHRIREAKAALEKEAAQARAAQLREQAAAQSQRADVAHDATERKRAATRAAKSRSQADELSERHDDDDDDGSGGGAVSGLPSHQVPATPSGEPTDKAQRNFTDPDSRIMVRNGVFLQAYNAQAVVSESQLVVAHAVTNQPPDTQHLVPMMERVRETCGSLPELLSADSGYVSEANITYCAAHGIDAYLAVRRKGDDDASLGRLPMTQGAGAPLADAPEGEHAPRASHLRASQGHRRAGLRPDQTGHGLPTLLAARAGQGGSRMGDRVPLPQHAQAAPSPRRAQAQRRGWLTRRRRPTPGSTDDVGL